MLKGSSWIRITKIENSIECQFLLERSGEYSVNRKHISGVNFNTVLNELTDEIKRYFEG